MKIPQTEGRKVKYVTMNYHAQQLPIFPCKLLEPWENRFLENACNGFTGRYNWDKEFPEANIGFATGLNCFVIEANYPDGAISLAKLEKRHALLPETAEVRTGNGARQIFFYCPYNSTIPNSVDQLGEGIAVYGKGQFVLLPPSIQHNDEQNKWRTSTPIADAPQWLIELLSVLRSEEGY